MQLGKVEYLVGQMVERAGDDELNISPLRDIALGHLFHNLSYPVECQQGFTALKLDRERRSIGLEQAIDRRRGIVV